MLIVLVSELTTDASHEALTLSNKVASDVEYTDQATEMNTIDMVSTEIYLYHMLFMWWYIFDCCHVF